MVKGRRIALAGLLALTVLAAFALTGCGLLRSALEAAAEAEGSRATALPADTTEAARATSAPEEEAEATPEPTPEPALDPIEPMEPIEGFVAACVAAFGEVPVSLDGKSAEAICDFLSCYVALVPDALENRDPEGLYPGKVLLIFSDVDALFVRHTGYAALSVPDEASLGGDLGFSQNVFLIEPWAEYPDGRTEVSRSGDAVTATAPDGETFAFTVDGELLLPEGKGLPLIEEDVNYGYLDHGVQAVSASSSLSGYGPELAVKRFRDEGDSWITEPGDTAGAWIRVEFPRPYKFTALEVGAYTGGGKDYEHGRIKSYELRFDDGSTLAGEFEQYVAYNEITFPSTKTISWVELHVTDAYPGELYDDVFITSLSFYQPWDDPKYTYRAPLITTPEGGEAGTDATGFIPTWFNWEATGYDAQDIDNPTLRAGKWVTADGAVCMYTDFSGSTDGMEYELFSARDRMYYDSGVTFFDIIDYYEYGDWNDPIGFDANYGITISSPAKGEICVDLPDGETLHLYLARAKYTMFD